MSHWLTYCCSAELGGTAGQLPWASLMYESMSGSVRSADTKTTWTFDEEPVDEDKVKIPCCKQVNKLMALGHVRSNRINSEPWIIQFWLLFTAKIGKQTLRLTFINGNRSIIIFKLAPPFLVGPIRHFKYYWARAWRWLQKRQSDIVSVNSSACQSRIN